MSITVIDYGSGNLRSAAKALEAAADNTNLDLKIVVTSNPEVIKKSNKVILPGQGSFRDCYLGIKKALHSSKGIKRYAHALIPMDETLTRVSIDISNRPYLIWRVKLKVEKLGEMDTELFKEWFQAFSQAAGITLHIENVYGDNSHHIIESCFKGLARSLREALEIDKRIKNRIPSTKGVL